MARGNVYLNNRSGYLYLLLLLCFSNCNSQIDNKEKIEIKNDSTNITLNYIPPETTTSFIYMNKDLANTIIEFKNTSKYNQNITKKIPKINLNNFIIMYRCVVFIGGKLKTIKHDYCIDSNIKNIAFDFHDGDITLKTVDKSIIIVDEIYKQYSDVYKKNYSNSDDKTKIKSFENLYKKNKIIFSNTNNEIKLAINELEFLNQLSRINPNDKRIRSYLYNLQKPIWSSTLSGLFYYKIESIKDSIYNIDLNEKKYTDSFKQILSIKVNTHLQINKNKQYSSYGKNINWLQKTEYYKQNKNEIDINLKPESSVEDSLAKRISLIVTNDYSNNEINIRKIIEKIDSKYFLIDLWATWCSPCIQNIKAIHKLDLPKNIEIIYISMDKTKDKDKWLFKSKEMNLKNSYLFIENENNKKIIKEIGLNQLPRYILIDNNFKIIDFNLITPQEGDFLKELKQYVN